MGEFAAPRWSAGVFQPAALRECLQRGAVEHAQQLVLEADEAERLQIAQGAIHRLAGDSGNRGDGRLRERETMARRQGAREAELVEQVQQGVCDAIARVTRIPREQSLSQLCDAVAQLVRQRAGKPAIGGEQPSELRLRQADDGRRHQRAQEHGSPRRDERSAAQHPRLRPDDLEYLHVAVCEADLDRQRPVEYGDDVVGEGMQQHRRPDRQPSARDTGVARENVRQRVSRHESCVSLFAKHPGWLIWLAKSTVQRYRCDE